MSTVKLEPAESVDDLINLLTFHLEEEQIENTPQSKKSKSTSSDIMKPCSVVLTRLSPSRMSYNGIVCNSTNLDVHSPVFNKWWENSKDLH